MRSFLVTILLVVSSVAAVAQKTAEQVVAAMHQRYAAAWYRTLTFDQQSITHKPDGTSSSEMWHEAMIVPGRLRIDFGDPSVHNFALFAANHQYIYRAGKLSADRARIHPLLVLGFDVYGQPVPTTLQQLTDLHIDLATMHEEDFNGRPCYVIGAKSGDLRSVQFWIDKERLYFVRLVEPGDIDPKTTEDIRFDAYRQVEGGGWVAEHVILYSDGKLVFEEKYSNVRVNPELSPAQFDPKSVAVPGT